ncbi:hypothetical protein EDI_049930 [Entamoeba dispar SAW760]|uniref:Conserved oligomeric Golgi complex subunit 4 N-terminal domain-containing protein n=1 Tax=Entamoeba dispar (strain ATCC PRA-260 / SAW760) TaxID=370354 RepID=B0EK07_ENTDS|nr:uncharacterized protein EDI_049930 [Entamoeba dispar SAW760]EDR25134.1 hypothetical protein EDI_049930 [Entamoeba dispar SAW760]|eukprot:EDR25134.1 hypothetical protein EDI_049930 [Entamoeba dispar SAW760]
METNKIEQIQSQINEILTLINSSLPPIQEKTENFRKIIDQAANNASGINSDIKRIERTQDRINLVLQMLVVAKEQRNVVNKCKESFKTKDYDGTVRHFVQLKSYGNKCSRIMKEEINLLQKSIEEEFMNNFKNATEKGDMKQILRYTDLMIRIGSSEFATKQYITYYTTLILNESTTIKEKLLKLDINTIKAEAIFTKTIQGFVDFSLKVVSRQNSIKAIDVFQPDKYYFIIQQLYDQINICVLTLVITFTSIRRISSLQTQKGTKDYPEQDVLIVLDETSSISNVISFYKDYFNDFLGKINASDEVKNKPIESIKKLDDELDKLLNSFVLLEESYVSVTLTHSIKERIKIAEFGEALDLFFYVLQQSAERVVLTKSFQTICAIINLHVNMIKSYLLPMTKNVVRDNTSFTNILSKEALTCIDSCEANIIKLHSTLSLKINTLWRNNLKYLEMVNTNLDDLLATRELFTNLSK